MVENGQTLSMAAAYASAVAMIGLGRQALAVASAVGSDGDSFHGHSNCWRSQASARTQDLELPALGICVDRRRPQRISMGDMSHRTEMTRVYARAKTVCA